MLYLEAYPTFDTSHQRGGCTRRSEGLRIVKHHRQAGKDFDEFLRGSMVLSDILCHAENS
jgi:hypothetical protein